MKTKLTTIALILLIAVSCKKEIDAPESVEEFTIESKINSGMYKIKVALPENYDRQNKKYSTIYVLDGDDNFNFVAYHCKNISKKYATDNTLVVSIGYGHDRAFDYTPTKADHNGGGAAFFMEFIENELIPKMEKEFAANANRNGRVILGHSFGALFDIYAFTKRNTVFGNYIMCSPSIWYDNEVVLEYELENRNLNKNNPQLIFLGIGQLENAGRMQAPFEALYQILNKNYTVLKLTKNRVPEMDHMASRNANIIKGLEFYFQNR